MRGALKVGLLAFVLLGSGLCPAQQYQLVTPGQKMTITGRLAIESIGWHRFFVLQIPIAYSLDFDKEDGGPIATHQVAFYLPGRTEEVEKLVGQTVTVTGSLGLNGSSPYYWKGTMLQAQRLESATGIVLGERQRSADDGAWRDGPKSFVAVIKLFPDKMLPQYSLLSADPEAAPLRGFSCGVNGGGDVLNCSCPDGYVASRVGRVSKGRFVSTSRVDELQWMIGPDSTRPITVAAECLRKE